MAAWYIEMLADGSGMIEHLTAPWDNRYVFLARVSAILPWMRPSGSSLCPRYYCATGQV
jgi:hypothetical protein